MENFTSIKSVILKVLNPEFITSEISINVENNLNYLFNKYGYIDEYLISESITDNGYTYGDFNVRKSKVDNKEVYILYNKNEFVSGKIYIK